MTDNGYLIEQGVSIAVTLALHLGFWLQFAVERRRPSDGPAKDSVVRAFEKQRGFAAVFNIQYVCNRVGILASFLQLVRLIDPVNVHGIYPLEVNEFISYNISAVLLTLFVAFVAITARIRYSMQNMSLPKTLLAFFSTIVIAVFIGANGLPLASHLPTANHFWTYGVFLWSFIAVELSLLIVLDYQVFHLKRLFTSYQMSHEGDTALALIRATRKLNYQGNPLRIAALQVKPATAKPHVSSSHNDPNSLLQPEISQISTTAVNISESRRNSFGSAAVNFLTAMFGPRDSAVPRGSSDSNNPTNSSRSGPHQQHAIEMSAASLAGTLAFHSLSHQTHSSQTHTSSSPFLSSSHSGSSVTGLGYNHHSSSALSSLSEEKRSGHDHSIRVFRSASPIAEESISRVVSDASICAPQTSFGTRVPTDHGPSAFSVVVSVPSPIVAPIVPSLLPSSSPLPELRLFQPIASPDSGFRLDAEALPLTISSSEPVTPSSAVLPSPTSAQDHHQQGPYSSSFSAALSSAVPLPAGPRLFLPRMSSSSQSQAGSILGRPLPSLLDPTGHDGARVSRAPSTASSTDFSTNDLAATEDPRSPGRNSDIGSGVFNLQHTAFLPSRTPSTSIADVSVFCRGQSEPIGQPMPSTASSSLCVSPSDSAHHLSVRGTFARAPSDTPARLYRPSPQQRPSRHTDSPAGLAMIAAIITGTVAEVPSSPPDSPGGRWSVSPSPVGPQPAQQRQSPPDTPNPLKQSHLSTAALPTRHERSRVSTSVGGSTKEGLRNEKIEQSLARLTMVQIVTHILLAVITGLQAYIGYQTFTGEIDQFVGVQVSPESYSPSQSEFLWIQDILLCLVLWYSWTPLKQGSVQTAATRSPIVSARRTANLLSPKRRAHAERRPSASVGGPVRSEVVSPAESQDAVSHIASPPFEYRPSGRTRRASAPAVLIASQSMRVTSRVSALDAAADHEADQSTPKRTRSDRGVVSPAPVRVHSLDDTSIAVGSNAAAQSNFGRVTTFELPLFKSWKEQQRNRRRLRRVISVQTQLPVDTTAHS